MTQQLVLKSSADMETVCSICRHFIENEGMYFCKFFDSILSEETLFIPCEFQEL